MGRKRLIFLFIILLSISNSAIGQFETRPMIQGPQNLQVNSYTGNLFYQRNDLFIPGLGSLIEINFSYNSSLDSLNFGYGFGWTFNYNLQYHFDSLDVIVLGKDGKRDTFQFDGSKYVAPAGVHDTLFEYQSNQFKLRNKFGLEYFFENATHKKLTKILEPNGNTLDITYINSLPTIISNSSGRSVSLTWSNGLLSKIEENNGATLRILDYQYLDNELIQVTDPLGNSETYEYSDDHSLNEIVDKRGNSTSIVYEETMKVKKIISCLGEQKFTFYNNLTYSVEQGSAGNSITSYKFDEFGILESIEDPFGNTTNYLFDVNQNLIGLNDRNGKNYNYSYDNKGNLLSITDPMGTTVQITYTSDFNKVSSITDRNGNTTTFVYDSFGNKKSVSRPQGYHNNLFYNSNGSLNYFINANGDTTSFIYDGIGNLLETKYPIGTQYFEYNGLGYVTKFTNQIGGEYEFEYDDLNQLIKITDPLNKTTTFQYDNNGNLLSEVDANQNSIDYVFDELNRLICKINASGKTTYEYDPSGNLIRLSDENNFITTYTYNRRNELVSEKDPKGNLTVFEYDNNGNLIKKTAPNGNEIIYAYDALNRLISKSYPENIDYFNYDNEGNLVNTYNDDINISYSYDELNQITTKVYNTWNKSIDFTYDAIGNRKSMIDPDGGITNYSYDQNNRIISIENPNSQITIFTYDMLGRQTRIDHSNGTYSTYLYDLSNNLLELNNYFSSNSLISQYTYTYDNVGNRLSMTDLVGTNTYVYDSIYQITGVNYSNGNVENFSYDNNGNRTQVSLNSIITNYTYNEANQLLGAGNVDYEFDDSGNLSNENDNGNNTQYIYDGLNRLIKVVLLNGNSNIFKYDPLGNRIKKIDSNGLTTNYLYDGNNILMELGNSGNTQARHTTGFNLDEWISMDKNGLSYYFHKDGLGSITGLTNSMETVENIYEYDIFGNVNSSVENIPNSIKFTGREFDPEIGIYYYRARSYDPSLGRFLQEDPLDRIDGNNLYLYVNNNPVNFIDPNGEFIVATIFVVATAAGALKTAKNLFDGLEKAAEVNEKAQGDYVRELQNILDGKPNADAFNKANVRQHQARYEAQSKAVVQVLKTGGETAIQAATPLKGALKKDLIKTSQALVLDWQPSFENEETSNEGLNNTSNNNSNFGSQSYPGNNNNSSNTTSIAIDRLHAVDPNEIAGPIGYELEQWMSINDVFGYTVYFENDPDFATAPAQKTEIRVPVDSNFNIYSFRLGDFGFGSFVFQIPPNSTFYSERLDVVDSLNVFVDVTAGIDITKHELFWIFESIDPITGLAPEDPLTGFLPVNDTSITIYNDTLIQDGEGFVSYTIEPTPILITGDSVKAQASIIFDFNSAIETNSWKNLIDALGPTTNADSTSVAIIPNNIALTFSGIDDPGGVGIDKYNLYVAVDTADFYLYQSGIDTTVFNFQVVPGLNYGFYTRGIDYVGNIETPKNVADLVVNLPSNLFPCDSINLVFIEGAIIQEGEYRASQNLFSSGIVQNPDSVRFSAGQEIDLLPGFTVQLGANMYALIENCELVISKPLIKRVSFSEGQKQMGSFSNLKLKPISSRNRKLFNFYLGVPYDQKLSIKIKDSFGNILYELLTNQKIEEGYYLIPIDLRKHPSGTYSLIIQGDPGKIIREINSR